MASPNSGLQFHVLSKLQLHQLYKFCSFSLSTTRILLARLTYRYVSAITVKSLIQLPRTCVKCSMAPGLDRGTTMSIYNGYNSSSCHSNASLTPLIKSCTTGCRFSSNHFSQLYVVPILRTIFIKSPKTIHAHQYYYYYLHNFS